MEERIFEARLPLKYVGQEVRLQPWLRATLVEGDDSPLMRAGQFFRDFDVPQKEVALFEDAFRVFVDSPTVITIREKPEEPLIFIRNEPYAKVTICLPVEPLLLPVKAGSLVEEIATVDKAARGRAVTSEEHLVVALNRILFAAHDALHTTMAESHGDNLNMLIHQLAAFDVFDPDNVVKTGMLVTGWAQYEHYSQWFKPTRELINSVIGYPPDWKNEDGIVEVAGNEISPHGLLTQYHEMTFDMVAMESSRALLLKMPKVIAWVHANIQSLVMRLRELHASLLKIADKAQLPAFRRITNALDALRRVYFAVFEDSQEAKAFLGETSDTLDFDELKIANIISECTAILVEDVNPYAVRCWRYNFPISKQGWAALEFDKKHTRYLGGHAQGHQYIRSNKIVPITTSGVDLAARAIDGLAKKNKGFEDCVKIFQSLEYIAYRSNANESDTQWLLRKRESFNDETGGDFSPDEVLEMAGVTLPLLPDEKNYSKNWVFYSKVFKRLRANNIAQVRGHVHACFTHDTPGVRGLASYMGMARDLTDWRMNKWNRGDLHTWKKIAKDARLGIFGLDMNNLTWEQRAIVQKNWRQLREYWFSSAHSQIATRKVRELCFQSLRIMAEFKRNQQKLVPSI